MVIAQWKPHFQFTTARNTEIPAHIKDFSNLTCAVCFWLIYIHRSYLYLLGYSLACSVSSHSIHTVFLEYSNRKLCCIIHRNWIFQSVVCGDGSRQEGLGLIWWGGRQCIIGLHSNQQGSDTWWAHLIALTIPDQFLIYHTLVERQY